MKMRRNELLIQKSPENTKKAAQFGFSGFMVRKQA